jgi:negative regulator of flagellin synthesis FlgM
MMIDRIGHVEPIQPGKKPGRSDHIRGSDRTDTIDLSSEAREKAELFQVVELIKSAPDMDDSQIASLRAKIDDPAYVNDKVLNATADKIIDAFGI